MKTITFTSTPTSPEIDAIIFWITIFFDEATRLNRQSELRCLAILVKNALAENLYPLPASFEMERVGIPKEIEQRLLGKDGRLKAEARQAFEIILQQDPERDPLVKFFFEKEAEIANFISDHEEEGIDEH